MRYELFDSSSFSSGLPKFLLEKAMQDESLALHIHWNVYSEKFNTENDKKEKDYFEWFYEELMAELEEK